MRRQGRITGYDTWGAGSGYERIRADISHLWKPCSDLEHVFSDHTSADAKQSFDHGLWAVWGRNARALTAAYDDYNHVTGLISPDDDLLTHEPFWLPCLEGKIFISKCDIEAGTFEIDDFIYGQIAEYDMPLIFFRGNVNWGHWIVDVLGNLLALDYFPELSGRKILFSILTPPQQECLDLLGLPRERVMSLPAPGVSASSILLSDVAVTSPPPEAMIYPWVSQRLRQGAGGPADAAPERVFLSRRRYYPAHRIYNQDEVERLFEDRGFTILAPETMSVAEFVRAVSRARIVAGALGGSLGNFLLAPANSLQIHLMPDQFKSNFFGPAVLKRKFFVKYYYPLLDRLMMVFGDTENPQSQAFAQNHSGLFGIDVPPLFDLRALDHAIMVAEKRLAIEDRLSR